MAQPNSDIQWTIEAALGMARRHAEMSDLSHDHLARELVAIDAALARLKQAREAGQPAPDSAGWWAFEGHFNFTNGLYPPGQPMRDVARVYWGDTTRQFFARQESGIRPTKMLVGKWTRLHMPWDTPGAAAQHGAASPQAMPAVDEEVTGD